ncbi:MAG: PLP-dependent aminotransferase family protein [bacterium]
MPIKIRYEMFDINEAIHISSGLPRTSILPVQELYKKMARSVGGEKYPGLLQYGYTSGYPKFRESLAKFLERQRGKPVDPDRLFITNGATQGVILSILALSKGPASIIVEQPTYFPFLDLFRELNLKTHFVDIDKNGINVDLVSSCIRNLHGSVFVYTIPFFQNPTGNCSDDNQKRTLINLVEESKSILLSDEVYELLYFDNTYRNSLHLIKPSDRIISLGSFSKILGPGLRLGWLEANSSVLGKVNESGWVQSSGGMNPLVCKMVQELLDSREVDKILHQWRLYLKQRCLGLSSMLTDLFPEAIYTVPNGGYFIWTNFKNNILSDSVFREYLRREKKIIYVPGRKCAPFAKKYWGYIRLGYACYPDYIMKKGLGRLKEGLEQFKDRG